MTSDDDARGMMLFVLPLLALTFGGAFSLLWCIRRWSALNLGRFAHAVRALVLLTLVALGAFFLVARAVGVSWFTYVLAFALATSAAWREMK